MNKDGDKSRVPAGKEDEQHHRRSSKKPPRTKPTLSVGIPNYNHARFLHEQLESIFLQSYVPLEVIVLDDCSTDNSLDVLNSFACQHLNMQVMRNERNMGPTWTVNRLIELTKGEYVYLPSADDRILPGFFEKTMALLARNPEAGLCSATGYLIDEDGSRRGLRAFPIVSSKPQYFPPHDVRMILHKFGRWFEATSVIYRRDTLVAEGGYHNEIGSFSDTFANLVISLRHGVCYIPEPLTCWRQLRSGYGSRVPGGWQGVLERGVYVTKLMRGEYGNVFPPEYVNTFEAHWKYMVAVTAGRCAMIDLTRTLQESLAKLCPSQSLSDRIFWQFMQLLLKIQSTVFGLYFAAKFGPWRWWFRGRLSIILNLKRLVIREKLDT